MSVANRTRTFLVIALASGLLATLHVSAAEQQEPDRSRPEFKFYGYIKLDSAYDNSRVNAGNFARWVESEIILEDDSQYSMTANQTRVGVDITARSTSRVTTRGKLEIDFYGAGAAENKAEPMLRHAYVTFTWPHKHLTILAGQASDIISPLTLPTVNYSAGWWQGNIGYRRAQIRITKKVALSDKTDLEFTIAPTRTITGSTFVTGTIDSGADAALPTFQGRMAFDFRGAEGKRSSIGVSGHWGEEDQHITDPMGMIIGHRDVETWSINLDVRVKLSKKVLLQGEWFHGENINAYLGAIGQSEVEASGGWVAATITSGPRWKTSLGAGIDDPLDADLSAVDARSWNGAFFVNTNHSLTPDLTLSLEVMALRTRYLGQKDGDALRQQLAVLYKF